MKNQPIDRHEVILGMPVSIAIELWKKRGAEKIPVSQGEDCVDLEKYLSRRDVSPKHLEAVKAWLQSNEEGGEPC